MAHEFGTEYRSTRFVLEWEDYQTTATTYNPPCKLNLFSFVVISQP